MKLFHIFFITTDYLNLFLSFLNQSESTFGRDRLTFRNFFYIRQFIQHCIRVSIINKSILECQVEAVLDEKNIKGAKHFLIRWKGYEEESDTWEPEDTLDCKELIEEFKKKKKDKGLKLFKKKKETKQQEWDENEDFEVKIKHYSII